MKIFKHFNQSNNDVCPICNKNTDKETVLLKQARTQKGNLVEGQQAHLDCLDLWIDDAFQGGIIYQWIEK